MKNLNRASRGLSVKESFCGACLAAPLALTGVGVAGAGAKSNRKMKAILLFGGIGITLISAIVTIVYLKSCKSCR